MPASTREILLGRYLYDPLDRLVDCTPFEQSAIQRYYCKTRLSTELQGAMQRTIVQHDEQLLAQQQSEGDKTTATLLATDQQRSVLSACDANQSYPLAYSPYGHRPPENGLLSLLGFNGERPDPVTGHYHLGNGYRQFNPVLMRFNSPDSWSPFGEGGLNAYAYCEGEPVLRSDQDGHAFGFLKALGRKLGLRSSAKIKAAHNFNANPKPLSSELFLDSDVLNFRNRKTTSTAKYIKKSNTLFLDKEVITDKFSFTTRTKMNSKYRQLKYETLTSIQPNLNLKTIDPDTLKYVKNVQKHKLSTVNEKNYLEIPHPITEQNRIRFERSREANRTDHPSWHDWFGTSSSGGIDARRQ